MMRLIEKKAVRPYAVPKLPFDLRNGLLHTDVYKYIIRTAIRNISGQRTLLLFIYSKERLLSGNLRPRWTTFQTKSDYTTLSFRENKAATWQVSLLENLEREWNFAGHCAFYSKTDEERVTRFCSDGEKAGLSALSRLQWGIKNKKELMRRHAKQRKIIARMAHLPPLPRGLNGWLHREILPQYLFYHYHKGKSPMRGYCTACKHDVEVVGAKHGKKGICPRCKKQVEFKAQGRIGYIVDRETYQVIQKLDNGELVIRILKAYNEYRKKTVSETSVYEAMRIFVRADTEKGLITEPYHESYSTGDLTPWKTGYHPIRYMYQENFYADVCGHLYCKNLDDVLQKTPWQYSQLKRFYQYDHVPLQLTTFLSALLRQPKLEMLIKLGFVRLAADVIYRGTYASILDETKKRPHEILRVGAKDIPFLKECGVTLSALTVYQHYAQLKLPDRNSLFCWQSERGISGFQRLKTALQLTTVHKLTRYIDGQYELLKNRRVQGAYRYTEPGYVLNEYDDYLQMCLKENYDLKNDFILFPRDLQAAHDRVSTRIKLKADIKRHQAFVQAYQAIRSHLNFEKYGLMIVYPEKPEDIVREGNELHHCVGNYVSKVAEKQCIILFLRRTEDPQTPFVTIEVRDGEVVQVRGKNNSEPPKEVERFMRLWEQNVLHARPLPVAA